jgi:hypothetical protein
VIRGVLVVMALAGVAHAQPGQAAPDPAVEDASEANLESTANRQGLTFTGALGGGLIVGFGIKDSVGRGGSLSLRLGHVATRRTVLTFELGVTASLHKAATTSDTKPNTNTNIAAGAQHYLNPSLWLRLAGGVGAYQRRDVMLPGGVIGNRSLVGPVVVGGFGVDVLRFKATVVGFEIATSMMASGDGVLMASGLDVALSFD